MLQTAPVLPSNAPPLRDEGVYQVSRVLQEHSGNRQQYEYTTGYEQKYSTPVSTEDAWPQQQASVGHTPQLYQPQQQYRQPSIYASRQACHYNYPDDEQRITRQANMLFARFEASKAYQKYRERQQKEDKGGQEQKWPDHLERAFFRGAFL